MSDRLTLYVCHINEGGPKPHACRHAIEALREHGHDFELKLADGSTINGGSSIVEWAKAHTAPEARAPTA